MGRIAPRGSIKKCAKWGRLTPRVGSDARFLLGTFAADDPSVMRRRFCIGLIFVLGCADGGFGNGGRSMGAPSTEDDAGSDSYFSRDGQVPLEDASTTDTGTASMLDAGTSATTGTPDSGAGTTAMPMPTLGMCAMTPPAGSPTPPPPPTYSGTCPSLVAGHNHITSSGNTRDFRLVLPTDYDPSKSYPLFFLWHWLAGSADAFYTDGQVQTAADTQEFIAVIPEEKGDLPQNWPYTVADSSARFNEEVQFFDDMYACAAAQLPINTECVTTVGVSSGALWTDQLVGVRGQYFSSFISLSGGTGGRFIKPWQSTSHHMPAMVLWGGPGDACSIISMAQGSMDLESHLASEGHFFVECVHNCGHSVPPIMGTTSAYSPLWEFVLQHPYWLTDGSSPYQNSGLPSDFPSWCGIGAGSATPRTGSCPASAC